MDKIIAAGLSATIQETILFNSVRLDRVNRSSSYRLDASGKAANDARVLNQLEPGAVTLLCAPGEENASLFLSLASDDSLSVVPVRVPGRTRYCYTLLEPGSGRTTELVVGEPVRADPAARSAFDAAGERILRELDKLLAHKSVALLLAGSRPESFAEDLYLRMCLSARRAEVPVLADFHGDDLRRVLAVAPPSVVKINEEEFLSLLGYSGDVPGEAELVRLIEAERARTGSVFVITRGTQPVIGVASKTVILPVDPVEAVNATGSGDAFSAGFLKEWVSSGDLLASMQAGCKCGRLNALSVRPGSLSD